ncbi:MAG: type II toxin-antitoxin system VapC family toxin [Actinomycetota bacterium]|nr:type II toxin-antitoxin system VapC family toxin [Actinomycetota bacterium]
MIVLDASVALDALLSPKGMDSIASHELAAPPIMWSEVTAALREAVWRRLLTRQSGLEGLARLETAPIKRSSPEGLQREAWLIAEQLGWARTYDAEYVALAKLTNSLLLTRDARLKRAAGDLVEVVDPTQI